MPLWRPFARDLQETVTSNTRRQCVVAFSNCHSNYKLQQVYNRYPYFMQSPSLLLSFIGQSTGYLVGINLLTFTAAT